MGNLRDSEILPRPCVNCRDPNLMSGLCVFLEEREPSATIVCTWEDSNVWGEECQKYGKENSPREPMTTTGPTPDSAPAKENAQHLRKNSFRVFLRTYLYITWPKEFFVGCSGDCLHRLDSIEAYRHTANSERVSRETDDL